jgi:transketolase
METQLDKHYNALTLEFENMYRAADDIQRKTKQTLEVYGIKNSLSDLQAILASFVGGEADLAASTATTAAGAASASDLTALGERVSALETAAGITPSNP